MTDISMPLTAYARGAGSDRASLDPRLARATGSPELLGLLLGLGSAALHLVPRGARRRP